MVPYEVTIHTGDKQNAGTDSQVFLKAFGANGATSDVVVEKLSERFERGRADLIKVTRILTLSELHSVGTRPCDNDNN